MGNKCNQGTLSEMINKIMLGKKTVKSSGHVRKWVAGWSSAEGLPVWQTQALGSVPPSRCMRKRWAILLTWTPGHVRTRQAGGHPQPRMDSSQFGLCCWHSGHRLPASSLWACLPVPGFLTIYPEDFSESQMLPWPVAGAVHSVYFSLLQFSFASD